MTLEHLDVARLATITGLFAALTLVISVQTATAEDPVPLMALKGDRKAGAVKAGTCGGCHGADGNSVMPSWPKLAGQNAPYLRKQLTDFRDGHRDDPMMSGLAGVLTDQDIADLASHFSRQEIAPIRPRNQVLLSEGRELYHNGRPADMIAPCIGCHNGRGQGWKNVIEGGFPRIAGQHTGYTIKALKDFRSGVRANDHNAMMRAICAKLTDEDIAAVAEYVSGLP